jgi:hypothetical protein
VEMGIDRRLFMKMLGVGAIAGPGVLAGGDPVGAVVTGGIAVDSPGVYREDTRTMGFDVSRSPARASVEIMGETADGRLTAGEVMEILAAGGISYKTHIIHWNPKRVNLKEV